MCWHECPAGKYECGALCVDSEGDCVADMLKLGNDVFDVLADLVEGPEEAPAAIGLATTKVAPDLDHPICSNVS